MKKTLNIVMASAMMLLSASVSEAANQPKQPLKDWTIAVFLNA